MKKTIFILFLILFGCGTSGPSYNEMASTITKLSKEKARIFYLRPDRFEYMGRDAPITVNGTDIGDLPDGGFFYTDVEPNNMTISTSLWDVYGQWTIKFKPEAGVTYYIQIAPRGESVEAAMREGILGTVGESVGKSQGGAFQMDFLNEETAVKTLNELEYIKEQ